MGLIWGNLKIEKLSCCIICPCRWCWSIYYNYRAYFNLLSFVSNVRFCPKIHSGCHITLSASQLSFVFSSALFSCWFCLQQCDRNGTSEPWPFSDIILLLVMVKCCVNMYKKSVEVIWFLYSFQKRGGFFFYLVFSFNITAYPQSLWLFKTTVEIYRNWKLAAGV